MIFCEEKNNDVLKVNCELIVGKCIIIVYKSAKYSKLACKIPYVHLFLNFFPSIKDIFNEFLWKHTS